MSGKKETVNPDMQKTDGAEVSAVKPDAKGDKKAKKIFSESFKGKKLIGKDGVEIVFDKDGFVEGDLADEQKQRLISIGFSEKEV